MNFNYVPVASALHDKRSLSAMLAGHEKALAGIGGRRRDGAVADGEGVAFYFVQTGGVESEVIRRYRSRAQQGKAGRVLLIAHPAHNSLPAALEVTALPTCPGTWDACAARRDDPQNHFGGCVYKPIKSPYDGGESMSWG